MVENTINKTKDTFKADTVGSLLRPKRLKEAYDGFTNQDITKTDYLKIQHQEIKRIVKKQVNLGLKVVTDGEFSRSTFFTDFFYGLSGIRKTIASEKLNFKGKLVILDGFELTDKVTYNPNHPFFKSFSYLNSIVPKGVTVKQTIPSPTVILIPEEAKDISQPKIKKVFQFYDSRKQYLKAVVEAYRKTILHFYDLGCRYVQLDDPFWTSFIQPLRQAQGKNLEQLNHLLSEFTYVQKEIIKDLPSDLIVATHICRGNNQSTFLNSGGYDALIKYFKQLPYDAFFLEYDNLKREGDFSPLVKLYKAQSQAIFVLGLVTSKFPKLETKQYLKDKIKKATQYVPLDHLALSTQCGFASTWKGNKLTESDQWQKLKLVIDTAKEIWPVQSKNNLKPSTNLNQKGV